VPRSARRLVLTRDPVAHPYSRHRRRTSTGTADRTRRARGHVLFTGQPPRRLTRSPTGADRARCNSRCWWTAVNRELPIRPDYVRQESRRPRMKPLSPRSRRVDRHEGRVMIESIRGRSLLFARRALQGSDGRVLDTANRSSSESSEHQKVPALIGPRGGSHFFEESTRTGSVSKPRRSDSARTSSRGGGVEQRQEG